MPADAIRLIAVVVVAVLGFLVLDQTEALVLALDGPRSIPTVLSAALLFTTGAIAWSLSAQEPRDSSARARWQVGGVIFGLLGIDQVAGLHEWVPQWGDVSVGVAIVPVIVLGTIACGMLVGRLGDRPVTLALFAAGGLLWLGSYVAEALDRSSLDAVAGAGHLAGSGLLAGSLALYLPTERRPSSSGGGSEAQWALVERIVREADVRNTALALAVGILVFAALGGVLFGFDLRHDPASEGSVALADNILQWFDPNQELTYNTYFSALILAGAVALALLLAHLRAGKGSTAWRALAVVLVAMSVEELVDIHGKSQGATGVVAQLTFAPVILAAMAVGGAALRRMWAFRDARALFVAGALVWAGALLVDVLFGRESAAGIFEEALEMTGSAIFLLALLLVAKATMPADGVERRSAPSKG